MSVIQTWLGALDANACPRRLRSLEMSAGYGDSEGFFLYLTNSLILPCPLGVQQFNAILTLTTQN